MNGGFIPPGTQLPFDKVTGTTLGTKGTWVVAVHYRKIFGTKGFCVTAKTKCT